MRTPRAGWQDASSGPLAGGLARAFIALRYPVILAWIAGAVVIALALPALGGSQISSFSDLVPSNSAALRAEQISTREFGFPLLSETQVVVRNPQGLGAGRGADLVRLAAQLSEHKVPGFSQIEGAIPLVNGVGGPHFSPEATARPLCSTCSSGPRPARWSSRPPLLGSSEPGSGTPSRGVRGLHRSRSPPSRRKADKINGLLGWVRRWPRCCSWRWPSRSTSEHRGLRCSPWRRWLSRT